MNRTSLTTRYSLFAIALLATSGCYWGRRPLDDPTPFTRAPVWVWRGDSVEKWHAVRVTLDSVSGIPYRMSVHCDSCRRSVPHIFVDSMTVGYQTKFQQGAEIVIGLAVFTAAYGEFCKVAQPGDRAC